MITWVTSKRNLAKSKNNKFAYHYITYHFEVNPMQSQVKHVNFPVNHLTPDYTQFSAKRRGKNVYQRKTSGDVGPQNT